MERVALLDANPAGVGVPAAVAGSEEESGRFGHFHTVVVGPVVHNVGDVGGLDGQRRRERTRGDSRNEVGLAVSKKGLERAERHGDRGQWVITG